jgi:hypothetical protein
MICHRGTIGGDRRGELLSGTILIPETPCCEECGGTGWLDDHKCACQRIISERIYSPFEWFRAEGSIASWYARVER